MASDESSLRGLEALMTEFFAPATTNTRKREIEDMLNMFTQTQDCWKHSLFYMSNTSNEYVIMFCLSVLENVINKQWVGYSSSDKMEIRVTLNQFLYTHHSSVPSFIRNKLAKLVVDIGRSDWPHFYPDFFTNILQLVQDSSMAGLGVLLLKVTSEELMSPREDLSMARKGELHRLLVAHIPTVLALLNDILESVLEKHWHLVTATPPPSPTQGQSGGGGEGVGPTMLFSASSLQADNVMSNMFKSSSASPNQHNNNNNNSHHHRHHHNNNNHHHQRRLTPQQQQQQPPPLDRPSEALCRAALECLAHYFTWVPLSATITPTLLSTIFHYAAFGCEGAGGGGSTYAQRGGGGGVAPSPSTSNFATATLSSSSSQNSTVVPASNNNNNNTASACGALPGGGGGGGAMSAAAAAGGVGAGLGSAQLSASASSSSSSSSSSTSAPGVAGGGVGADTHQLGVLAMNCINELLSKNCVPQEFEEFLLQMFQRSFLLLQRLTRDSATSTNGNRLADLDESYVEKFTDFLQLFVSIHLRRFESNAKFPVLDFLALLFKYTFRQPTTEGFYSCLDIWSVFLDYLLTRTELRAADQEEVRNRYRPALQSLVTHILQKLQFRYNQSQLEQLDDETLDDDCQTEWQQYLRQCLEVVAKVGEILSRDTFKLLNDLFQEYTEVYLGLEQYVVPNSGGGAGGTTGAVAPPGGRKLTITAENECRRLHCILRDLSSLEQALGRLAEHFIGDTFMENFNDADVLVQRLVHCVAYSGSAKLYEVSSIAQTVLQPDFIEVHAQALATLKAFSHWLSQYHCESQKVNQPHQFTILFSTLVDATLPLFQTQIPEKIVQSAAHLLLSLMVTVRPSYLLQMASVQELYTHIGQGHCKDMPQEVQLLLYRALSHYLLLPWPHLSDSEQDWEKRAGYHRDFTRQLTLNYCQLRDTQVLLENKALQESAKVLIEKTLKMCRDWVENIASESNKSKHICYQSLQEIVQVTLAILPVYIHQPDTADHILSFFLAVFQGLRVQMGVSFTEGIIQTFMGLFTREQLAENILHDNSAGCRVVERFLCILELIVQEPGSAFKAFLPSIISVCMDQVYPIVAQRSSPDIKCKLYKLLFELLVNNWRYFFNTSLASTITALHNSSSSNTNSSNNGSNNSSSSDLVQNGEQFVAIMQAFGQSFLQPDIALFRQNLEALEALNTKWKLYHKKVFRDSLLCEFLTVLLQVLLQKSHDLLQEEIAISVYNMASVDFDVFYSHFLPNFLTSCDGLVADQRSVLGHNFKMDKDMPSFTQSVNRFINDLRYYRLINTSLPPGSFKF